MTRIWLSVTKPALSTQRPSEPEGHYKDIVWSILFLTDEETKAQRGERPVQHLPRGRARARIRVSPWQPELLYRPLWPVVCGTHV